MSMAKKCDRCGKLFEIDEVRSTYGFDYLIHKTEYGEELANITNLDLCADCCDELNTWLICKDTVVVRSQCI